MPGREIVWGRDEPWVWGRLPWPTCVGERWYWRVGEWGWRWDGERVCGRDEWCDGERVCGREKGSAHDWLAEVA